MDGVKRKSVSIQEYTLKDLAGIYEISLYRMRKKLAKIKMAIGERKNGNYYETEQVVLIFQNVKLPSHVEII